MRAVRGSIAVRTSCDRYNQAVVATIEVIHRAATRPTWAEISLPHWRANYGAVQQYVGRQVTICAVVKADAYGHGAVECSAALEQEGVRWLGVTSLDEAIPLREAGIEARILLMTGFWRGEEEEIVRLQITPTVWEPGQIKAMERAAARLGGGLQAIHLKVDTGMGRLGITPEQLPIILAELQSAEHLILEGLSTHLASSEVLDAPSVPQQLQRFESVRERLREAGFDPPLVHAANTSAVIAQQHSWFSMVRPGLALCGYHLHFEEAGREVADSRFSLELAPVLTWKTRILSLRDMPANQALGYGGTYITKAPAKIAVLPVGYADGLNRRLSSRGRVIVREQYAPIVGRISMDLTLVDVTAIPGVAMGDEVVLLGASETLRVDATEHARIANTIPYEILCSISKRVPRRYNE